MRAQRGLSAHLLRALLFVRLANEGGYNPSKRELDDYATAPEPRGSLRQSMLSAAAAELWTYASRGDQLAAYMVGLGWLQDANSGLALTALGASLAAGATGVDTGSKAAEPQGVVLRPGDDAVWTVLTRAVGRAGAGLLADPYFRDENLEWIAQATTIARVLTSTRAFNPRQPRSVMETELGRLVDNRTDLEVRVSDDPAFHDRYLAAAGGQVSLIGASLNGIGRHLTAILEAPATAQGPLHSHLEKLWKDAEPVEPRRGIGRQSLEDRATQAPVEE